MTIHETLIKSGFKRYKREKVGKEWLDVESDSLYVSSYGPVYYTYRRGEEFINWGLVECKSPRFFINDREVPDSEVLKMFKIV